MKFTAAALRRIFALAPLLLFFFSSLSLSDSPICTLKNLKSSLAYIDGGKFTATVPNGCLLRDSGLAPEHVLLPSGTLLTGGNDTSGSLRTDFATDAVSVSVPGLLTLVNLTLASVRVESSPFLQLSAFRAQTLKLSHVVLETDCLTLTALAAASQTLNSSSTSATTGTGYFYVERHVSSSVQAEDVNITCALPAVKIIDTGSHVAVANSLELLNALVVSQIPYLANIADAGGSTTGMHILFSANISLDTRIWRLGNPLNLNSNVTVGGQPGMLTCWDLQGLYDMVYMAPGVVVNLHDLVLLNAGPLRGAVKPLGMLPLFSVPLWFFNFTRIPEAPQLNSTNVNITLTANEYAYFIWWTNLLTGAKPGSVLDDMAAPLRATTPIINPMKQNDTRYLMYFQIMGTGTNSTNVIYTAVQPNIPGFMTILPNNLNLVFNFELVANMTHMAVFDLEDLMAALRSMQGSPPAFRTALYILSNITIDGDIWPAGGYNITEPLLLVGTSNVGNMTYINFQRIPYFIRVFGCSPDMYVFVQGLSLVNLPNTLKVLGGATDTALASPPLPPLSAHPSSGTSPTDVTLPLGNFVQANPDCHSPFLFINQTTIVITPGEYAVVRNIVSLTLGKSTAGSGTFLNKQITFNLSGIVVTEYIGFQDLFGLGWNGFKTSLTSVFPSGVTPLYNTGQFGIELPTGSGDTGRPPPTGQSDNSGLNAWQVALIVVGAVLFVALLTGLIAYSFVRRYKSEVEAVKSATSDKKSSSASGEQEGVNVAARLGSSAMAGGGSQRGNNASSSPANAKGSQGAGGGTSDDSTIAQSDRPPLEVLNSMMATLTQELDDRHLTILEVIGQGGFGVVYRAMWKGLNVAVKTITFQDRVAGGEKAQHRAILEAAISSSLAHPNVVTTYSYDIKPLTVQANGAGDSPTNGGQNGNAAAFGGGFKIVDKRAVLDWKLYLIQEYCDGGSLRTAILKRKFFDAKRGEPRMEMILDTCMELAGGLVHLHERNIIHGDLNPNNVLLKRDASKKYGAICKIADFGLSIKMSADQSHISNMRRGTPFYTCPQILARGNMTKAADVYSMGVVMWEMYHCCMSYRSLPTGFQARENFPNFPRKAPYDFARVVGACLDAEPSQRPTFASLRSDLETQLAALKRGELTSGEDVLGPDPGGDVAHLAACQD